MTVGANVGANRGKGKTEEWNSAQCCFVTRTLILNLLASVLHSDIMQMKVIVVRL